MFLSKLWSDCKNQTFIGRCKICRKTMMSCKQSHSMILCEYCWNYNVDEWGHELNAKKI